MKNIGKNIYIKLLSPDDVTPNYLNWLLDPDINKYLESRYKTYDLDSLKRYVKEINDSSNEYLFGIFTNDENKHIGNIKIGAINHIHRFGEIGLLIGDKSVWGKGYGTESIILATQIAFNELNLNKLIAGIYANNLGSIKAFEKAGYRVVGIKKKHRFFNGEYIDEFLVEKCRDD